MIVFAYLYFPESEKKKKTSQENLFRPENAKEISFMGIELKKKTP